MASLEKLAGVHAKWVGPYLTAIGYPDDDVALFACCAGDEESFVQDIVNPFLDGMKSTVDGSYHQSPHSRSLTRAVLVKLWRECVKSTETNYEKRDSSIIEKPNLQPARPPVQDNHKRFPCPNTSGDLCQAFTNDDFGDHPGNFRHPELPGDPGRDVKYEGLKTIIDQGSTEVPNHTRSPWTNTSGDLGQSFTNDGWGTNPGDYQRQELDVKHEELKTQAVTTITTEPGRIRYLWSVDAKKLESSDKQIASPDCEHGAAIFIMRIGATQVSMNKGGASFKRSEGKGHVTVKCLQGAADRQVRYQLWIGRRIDACTTRPGKQVKQMVEHNFTRSASSGLPKGVEEWDFKSFVEPGSSTFVVCLDIFFTDDDFAVGGAPGLTMPPARPLASPAVKFEAAPVSLNASRSNDLSHAGNELTPTYSCPARIAVSSLQSFDKSAPGGTTAFLTKTSTA